jgi:hypothetical protein
MRPVRTDQHGNLRPIAWDLMDGIAAVMNLGLDPRTIRHRDLAVLGHALADQVPPRAPVQAQALSPDMAKVLDQLAASRAREHRVSMGPVPAGHSTRGGTDPPATTAPEADLSPRPDISDVGIEQANDHGLVDHQQREVPETQQGKQVDWITGYLSKDRDDDEEWS